MSNKAGVKEGRPYSLPIAGPIILALFVLIIILYAFSFEEKKSALVYHLSSADRIEALDDSTLAVPVRLLPPEMSIDFNLKFDEGIKFDGKWESYPFMGTRSHTPLRPEKIIVNYGKIEKPSINDIKLLLDTVLRNSGPKQAINRAGIILSQNPENMDIQECCASFFEERLLIDKSLEIKESLLKLILKKIKITNDGKEKKKLAKKAQSVIFGIDKLRDDYLIKGNTDKFLLQLITACPDMPDLLFEYLERLYHKKEYGRALEVLISREKFIFDGASEVLSFKGKVLEKLGRIEQALELYESHPDLFVPQHDLFSGLLNLLERNHRLEDWRRDLTSRIDNGFDLPALTRLVHYYGEKGDYKLLLEQVEKTRNHGKKTNITEDELEKFADLCTTFAHSGLGDINLALRWNLYLLAQSKPDKDRAAARLALALTKSRSFSPLPVTKGMPGALTGFLDRYPGLTGGALSLDLNLRGTKERFAALPKAGARYENMRLALILSEGLISKDVSWEVASMSAKVAGDVYYNLKLFDQFVKVENHYLSLFPNGKDVPDVIWRLVKYYSGINDFEKELFNLNRLLAFAKENNDETLLTRVRKEIVRRYVREKQFAKVLPFYWKMIHEREDDEKLLREFIDFCWKHNIFEDTVKAYELAARRFDTLSYSDKLARYLIREKRRDAFENLTQSLAATLGENDLKTYLNRHVYYSGWESSKSRFFERMFLAALDRFPDNPYFLEKILNFYRGFERKQKQARLARVEILLKYFSIDPELGSDLCGELAAMGKLNAAVGEVLNQKNLNPVEARFLVAALGHLSKYEAQYSVVRKLNDIYNEKELTLITASLERSIDSSFYVEDPDITKTAAARYENLAKAYPANSEYYTRAGEVFVEAGMRKAGSRAWENILHIRPGREKQYLDLATLYWDYYLFEHGLSVIMQARTSLDKEAVLAKEAGFLYESMGKMDKAIGQYVLLICDSGDRDWETGNRLAKLEKDRDLRIKIDNAFTKRLDGKDSTYMEVLNYGRYLGGFDRRDRKTLIFKKYMNRYSQEEFLSTLSDYFGGMGHGALALKALELLADAANRSTDVLLRLLAFHETLENRQEIEKICLELGNRNGKGSPRYEEILRKVSQSRWKTGLKEKALDGYEELAGISKGTEKERRLFEYALKCLEGGREKIGVNTLLGLAAKRPERGRYISSIAEYYGRNNDYEKLATLYKSTIKKIKTSSLTRDEKRRRLTDHRRSLSAVLLKLERKTEALDHLMEVLNLHAPDKYITNEVFRFAGAHGLTKRLMEYYIKLSEKSHKDYRWQVVLGDIHAMSGETALAYGAYEKAVANEPHRLELYDLWAGALSRGEKYLEAYEVIQRRYDISGSKHDLRRLGEFAFQAGFRDKAIEKLLELTQSPSTPNWRIFEVAELFEKNMETALAQKLMGRALGRFKKDPLKNDISAGRLEKLAILRAKEKGYFNAYLFLEELKGWLDSKAGQNTGLIRSRLLRKKGMVEKVMTNSFAKAVFDYATREDFENLESYLVNMMRSEISKSAGIKSLLSKLRKDSGYYLRIAKSAGMIELKRATLKEKAIGVRKLGGRNSGLSEYRTYLNEMRKTGNPDLFIGHQKEIGFEYVIPRSAARYAFLAKDKICENKALKIYFDKGKMRSFQRPDKYRIRYLDYLNEQTNQNIQATLDGSPSYGAALAYFAWRGRSEIALRLLYDNWGTKSKSWLFRREIQIRESVGDGAGAKEKYQLLLRLPIKMGKMFEIPNNWDGAVSGNRWFLWAFKYGKLLATDEEDDYENFMLALAEKSPKDPDAYLSIAKELVTLKKFDEAMTYLLLAGQLTPESESVIRAYANLWFKKGGIIKGKTELEKLIDCPKDSVRKYRTYYLDMKENGLGPGALEKYKEMVLRNIGTFGRWVITDEMVFLANQEKNPAKTAEIFKKLVMKSKDGIYLVKYIDRNNLLPDAYMTWFFQFAAKKIRGSKNYSKWDKIQAYEKLLRICVKNSEREIGLGAIKEIRGISPYARSDIEFRRMEGELNLVCLDEPLGEQLFLEIVKKCQDEYCFEEMEKVAFDNSFIDLSKEIRYLLYQFRLKKGLLSSGGRIYLAKLYFERNLDKRATAQLEFVASSDGSNGDALLRIGVIYLENDLYLKALEHLKTASKIDPENGKVLFKLGVAFGCTGNISKGALIISNAFSKGLIGRSFIADEINFAVKTLIRNEKQEEFAMELANHPQEGVKLLRGALVFAERRYEEAVKIYKTLPDNSHFKQMKYILFADALVKAGDTAGSVEYINRGIINRPEDNDLVVKRFFTLYEDGEYAHALDSIEFRLPTDRYALLNPVSMDKTLSGVKDLPSSLGLSGEMGEKLLKCVGQAFLEMNYPAESMIYFKALLERIQGEPGEKALSQKIDNLEKQVRNMREKLSPWPLITAE